MYFVGVKCIQCGKNIYPPEIEEWVYRRENRLLCSWHCLCEYDRQHGGKRTSRRAAWTAETRRRNAEIYSLAESGKSYAELAGMYGMKESSIGMIVSDERSWRRENDC